MRRWLPAGAGARPLTRSVLAGLVLALAACAAPPREAQPPPAPQAGEVVVDAGLSLGPISPLVYGVNYGPWSVVPVELQPQAEAAGLTYLRFPGGNWGDQNDLKPFHLDQLFDLAGRLGAEAGISVRLRGGSAEAAVEVLRYTQSAGHTVRYWSIGNEPSLYPDYDTERYNAEWRAVALALRAADPNVLLVGPDLHQFTGDPARNPRDAAGRDWMRAFLLANGDLVDVVSVHRYPFPAAPADPPPTPAQLRATAAEWEVTLPYLRGLISETTGRDLPIAVTEVNSNWSPATGGEATPDSFYNALWWGDVLGRLIRHRVHIVAYFALQSGARTGGWGLLARTEVRPTYYVYALYQRLGSELVHGASGDAGVSVVAARRDDGALTLMLANLAPEPRRLTLRLRGFEPAGAAEAWRFDHAHNAEAVPAPDVADGATLSLPAESLTLLVQPGA